MPPVPPTPISVSDLVDIEYHFAGRLCDLFDQRFEANLEVALSFASGEHRGYVEREDPLALQLLRHLTTHDTPGQAFDDRILADAGIAEQNGVVLGPTRQHGDHASNLVLPTDEGVELVERRRLGEVVCELTQNREPLCYVVLLRSYGSDVLVLANGCTRTVKFLRRDAQVAHDAPDLCGLSYASLRTLEFAHRDQEVFIADELVPHFLHGSPSLP